MTMTAQDGHRDHLDHLVINALFELDAAAGIFASLGFQLTPRGHHSLGSINHLIMLPGCYIELVGLPNDTDRIRQEIVESPHGPSGFVPGSNDIEATRKRLFDIGLHPAAIQDFSRPVKVDGGEYAARFRTVLVPPEDFAAGRVYWCQHLTPELVWRDEWLVHDNGLHAIDHLVVESTDATADAQRYAAATGGRIEQHGGRSSVVLADDFRLVIQPSTRNRFTRIGLAFDGLGILASRASNRADVQWLFEEPDHASLAIPSLELTLDCRRL
jgi:hypothetical protein